MLKSLLLVARKELRRVFTDKRLVITSFLLPMISIAIIYSLMGIMIGRAEEDIKSHITRLSGINVPLVIQEIIRSDQTIDLSTQNISTSEAEKALLEGEIDYYIEFDEDFDLKIVDFQSGDIPIIRGLYSPKHDYSIQANYKINALMESYRHITLANRLGDEAYIQVYEMESGEINIPQENRGIDRGFASMIPLLVSIFIFAGAMGIGIDSIAGEKERGTMASMLITPIDRALIIGGKILSLSVVALISMSSSFMGVLISIPFSARIFSSTGSFEFSQLAMSSGDLGLFLISMIGLVGMYVSVIAVLSMIANSVKEAGAYITPAYMLVMISGFMNMFGSSDSSRIFQYIPIYNNLISMNKILSGDGSIPLSVISLLTSIGVTLIMLFIARSLIEKEKIVFPS